MTLIQVHQNQQQNMRIVQKKKHCGKPAPLGLFKIEGENITGRKKEYGIRELANIEIPTGAVEGRYTKMTMIEASSLDLEKVCTPHSIRGYPNGNNPADYNIILAMSEDIHTKGNMFKIALMNKKTNGIELYTSTNYPDIPNEDVGLVVECYKKGWYVWKQASLDSDVVFWLKLKEYCRLLSITI